MKIDRINLKVAMAVADMTQKDLSKASGVMECTVSKALNGGECRLDTVYKLATALKCNFEGLILKEEE